MTTLTVRNLAERSISVPGLGMIIPALTDVDLDWDQDAIDSVREEADRLEALYDSGDMRLLINGMMLPSFHCILITDCANVLNRTTKEYKEKVDATEYMNDEWILNPTPVDGVDPRYWFINPDDSLRAMTSAEIDIQEAPHMMEHKLKRINEVHNRTLELNAQGFFYRNCHFSLNEMAQMNWDAIITMSNAGILDFPMEISQSNGTKFSVADHTGLLEFAGIGMGIVSDNYKSERVLISQIWASSNKSSLDTVEDNR